jgi:hypothetical protein
VPVVWEPTALVVTTVVAPPVVREITRVPEEEHPISALTLRLRVESSSRVVAAVEEALPAVPVEQVACLDQTALMVRAWLVREALQLRVVMQV